ncbi:MAG: ferredoxin--NADP reductase [Fimbriiglobus sp.]
MLPPEQIAELRQQRYNGTVTYLHKTHPDLMVIRVRPDFPRPTYHPGQYCALGLGYWEPRVAGCQTEELKPEDLTKVVRRSYSISSSIESEPGKLRDMTQDDWLEFYVVLVRENPDGRVPALTPRLFALKEGDRLGIGEKIVGHFTSEPVKPGDTAVFLGTGTGEAPHNAMVWDLLRKGHTGKIVNACCVRFQKDLGYLETHRRLMETYPNYTYLGMTTREAGATKKKYIQDLLSSGELEEILGAPLDPASAHVFLCGNPKMIGVPVKDKATGVRSYPEPTGVIELLEKRGFQADQAAAKIKGNVHFEEYW